MNKKWISVTITLLLVTLLVGCSKKTKPTFSAANLTETTSSSSIEMAFAEFHGTMEKEIKTLSPSSIHIVCLVDAGSFELVIKNKKKKILYQKGGSIDETFAIDGPADYIIEFNGLAAGGNYLITWEPVVQ